MNGIDIARYQKGINLALVPCDFVIVKATQGKNAISPSKLREILKNTDSDKVKKLASPKVPANTLPKTKINRIKAMANSGYTLEEIAKALDISKSSVSKYIKGKED